MAGIKTKRTAELFALRQTDCYSCGRIASAVALELSGTPAVTANSLAHFYMPTTSLDGVDPRTLEAFFRKVGKPVQSGNFSVCDLVHHCSVARPIVCLVTLDSVGHWVVVYEATTRVIRYFCPVVGLVKTTPSKFESVWHDTDRDGEKLLGFGVAVLSDKR